MKSVVRILIGAGLFVAAACAWTQDKPLQLPGGSEIKLDKPADAAKTQLLYQKEKVIQLQFQLMQKEYQERAQPMQAQFADLEKEIAAWIEQVKKDNHLGDDVIYDREQDKWLRVPKPPVKTDKK